MPPGNENCLKNCLQAQLRSSLFSGIDLGICSLEVALGQDRGCAVPGPGNVDRVQVVLLDQPIEMDVGERLAGVRAPVAQHAWLDVLDLERLAEQGVVLEVQHPQAQVEAGPPISVDLSQFLCA